MSNTTIALAKSVHLLMVAPSTVKVADGPRLGGGGLACAQSYVPWSFCATVLVNWKSITVDTIS